MDTTRRSFLKTAIGTGSLVAAGGFALPARAAEFQYKLGHPYPENLPVHTHALAAAEKILKETNGRVDIKVYGNSALGGDTQMISQVRSGALQFYSGAGVIVSSLVPVAAISGVGFAFNNYKSIWTALDGNLGAHIRGAFGKAGLFAFDKCWDTGFRQVSSGTKPVKTPADLNGFKIRVPVSRAYTSLFSALGASPASINLAEVYSALQTKIVDGQENSLAVFAGAKFFEVQKYLSLTNHLWDGSWLLANGAAWKALPPELQTIVAKNFNEAAVAQRIESEKFNLDWRTRLKAQSVEFNDVNPDEFKAALRKAGYYKDWAERYGPEAWSLLEKYAGKLA
ncbi:TRAP transporter substrate-binding protein [Herbaspirillum autotrophicum]|uniref:TRAP transporter substrate-binding protein n=1 Tax=Herbaspirillum autotrophicum TaxID=180195 RepID=UPI00067E12D3|nr:TRAP transporter substrate-binding protein [Herbaspirillum autotrophicum]